MVQKPDEEDIGIAVVMVRFKCPQCEKSLKVDDELVGKRAKCRCGATFRVPGEKIQPAATQSYCSSCQQELQSGWIACPNCGTKVNGVQQSSAGNTVKTSLPGVPFVAASEESIVVAEIGGAESEGIFGNCESAPSSQAPMVQARDDAIVNAEINASSNVQIHGDHIPDANKLSPRSSMVRASGDAVVNAEIDASQTTSVAGDFVSKKEVNSVHTTNVSNVSNVYNESSARAIADVSVRAVAGVFSAATRKEQTPDEIIRKISTESHSGIGVGTWIVLVIFWPVGLYMLVTAFSRKKSKVNQLLSRLRSMVTAGDASRTDYDRIEQEWQAAQSELKKKSAFVFGFLFIAFLLFIALQIWAFGQIGKYEQEQKEIKSEVIRLIEEERFDAARLKATELPTFEREDVLETIDRAEKK
ncbi:zinc ribbon domain-containing protein [bacterium]|nr:zinc ribbon domain-containing protein [bacterium]